jgi:hypothetical protein
VTRRDRRTALVLGLLLLASFAYFYQAGGWNQNSRFALVRAILEHHSLSIDPYQDATYDRALWRGHYYSDKAAGVSLLAVPPTAIARLLSRVVGVDAGSDRGVAWTSYVATVATSGVFTVLAAVLIFMVSRSWGFSQGAALFAATAFGVATPAWCYATLFMDHAVVAGALMLAFGAAALGSDSFLTPWIVGLSAGFAVLCQIQAAPPAVLIGLFALSGSYRRGWPSLKPFLTRMCAGAAVMAIVFFAYNTAAFGSPLHIGYASEEGFDELRTAGIFGMSFPTACRMNEILFGSYRGILPLAPILAVMPIGLISLVGDERRRLPALTALGVAAYYFLWNASYYYWEGGWAYGPRHVVPALPLLALGLPPLWDASKVWMRALLVAGWICGTALTLVAVSTTPQPPGFTSDCPPVGDGLHRPVADLLWPAFRDGDLALNNQSFTTFRADASKLRDHPELHAGWNLGEIVGLRGRASLLPLGAIWIAGCWILVTSARRE